MIGFTVELDSRLDGFYDRMTCTKVPNEDSILVEIFDSAKDTGVAKAKIAKSDIVLMAKLVSGYGEIK